MRFRSESSFPQVVLEVLASLPKKTFVWFLQKKRRAPLWFSKRGIPQLSAVQRKLLCGRNCVGFFLQEGISSSPKNSSHHNEDGGSRPVASEGDLEYLEARSLVGLRFCMQVRPPSHERGLPSSRNRMEKDWGFFIQEDSCCPVRRRGWKKRERERERDRYVEFLQESACPLANPQVP